MSEHASETSTAVITEAGGIRLPELTEAVLDEATLDQLFLDIAACTRLLEVTVKLHPTSFAPQERVTLADARALIAARAVRGVQVRYLYDGGEWCDTLIVGGQGVRVVRIRQTDIPG